MAARRWRTTQGGVAMVEFALLAPVIFIFLFGLVDFSRIIQANTTVAEAARQAARQGAVNADSTPFFPFSSSPQTGSCSGTVFTVNADGDGCLTDARMVQTATTFMAQGGLTSTLTLEPDPTDATACRALAPPAAGSGIICIAPAEGGATNPVGTCPAQGASIPVTSEGNRASEWGSPQYRGCFVVQVTVIYTYSPLTGLLQNLIGNSFVLVSSTSTIAEY